MKRFSRLCRSLLLPVTMLTVTSIVYAADLVTSHLPLIFEPNQGQAPAEIRFRMRGGALEGEFQRDGVIFALPGSGKTASQLRMHLLGARKDTAMSGAGRLPSRTNYLLGNDQAQWLRGLPNYSQVRYTDLYPGTDLVFYGNGSLLEHDFEVMPGANPSSIAFDFEGAESITLAENGDLRVGLPDGAVTFNRPIAYQTVAGLRRKVDSAFLVGKDGSIRFRLGAYDRSAKLVIDPVLSFATYLSSLAPDANLIAIDASGNNYMAGYASLGYPVSSGAVIGCSGCTTNEVVTFVSKLSADGTQLLYSTVLGGNSFAQPTGLGVDANGNALVSGWTGASNFPTKNGQPIAPPNNAYLGFLVSLSPDGSSLNYGTMLGSPPSVSPAAMTYATAMTLDSSGNAYVTGITGDGFYTTSGALNQAAKSNSRNSFDVYLAKFSQTGTLLYSAILGTADPQNGGGGPIGATAISVDSAGDAFVAGQAGILWPVSSSAYLNQIAGLMPYATPFVTKVAPDAKSIVYSTYLDYAYVVTGITILANGNALVVGDDASATYPTTSNAYQINSGSSSAFLTELNANGSGLVYSTVLGDGSFKINALALDPDGDIWLAGQTSNPQFPLVNPIQATFPVSSGFSGPVSIVNQLDPTGQTMKFATFLGGSVPGYASSVAIDANHRAHVSGAAQYGMYTTPGVYDGSVPTPGSGYGGSTYAYVALIDSTSPSATLCLGKPSGLSFGYLLPQTSALQSVQVSNCGNAPLTISSIASNNGAFTVPTGSNGCAGSIAVGSSCTVSVQFTPATVAAYTGQLTFTSNAAISATSFPLSGSGGEPSAGFGPQGVTQMLSFSALLVGQTSPAESIALYNNGPVPLTINLSQIAVTSGFALAAGGNCPSVLAAHQSCWISVVFAPTTAGTMNGTLSVSSNDPVHPTITTSITGTAFTSYPIAAISALLNPSYPINSGASPITMSVFGTNFFPASVVCVDGIAQTTTYQSSTFLTVTFSPLLLNAVGAFPVTVVNPTPGGGSSAPYSLMGYLSIPLTASALTVDPVDGLLYAAIPSTATQNPNSVIPINPATGLSLTPIPVAVGPRALAVSDDGSELYVASTGVLQRINLKTYAIEKSFNLPVDPEWGQTYVQEMHVVPGSPQSIVVELFANVDPAEDGAALYSDSGLVNWIPGESLVNGGNSIFWPDSFTFTSTSNLYAIGEYGESFFYTLQNSATGLTRTGGGNPTTSSPMVGGHLVRSDGTLLYTNSGQVWDPSTQKLLGTYLQANGSQLFYTSSVLPEPASRHTYFLDTDGQYSQYQAVNIDVYDQASYALLGTVPFTSIYPPDVADLVRWGSNGFAFRSVDTTGYEPSANQIVIVTSNLIGSSNGAPIPILSSVSPSPVYVGGDPYTMQLTGSGFTSASTVLVNGNARTTTYVKSNSLTAQVLASDIATNGQFNVQVTTPAPGGGTSDFAIVSIEIPPATTPIVTVTPSATNTTNAQSLTVAIAVVGTTGKPTPTGSATLSGGGYASSASVLSNGGATITIPAGALTTGTDTLTATYTPDSSSVTNYNGATGSATVVITVPVKTTPTVTATPAASSITIAQSLSVSVTVSGGNGNPTPMGSLVLSGASYTSAVTSVSAGAATILIPAGSLTVGSDMLSLAYTPDSSSTSTYNSAIGSTSVTVTALGKSTSNVTVTPASATITNSESDVVSITVAGLSGQPAPTGAVTLASGTYNAQQTLTSGVATISIPAGTLSSGTDTLTVTYSGDGIYAATSGTASLAVAQVVVAASNPSGVLPGGSTTANITLSAGSNYSGTMNMSCALTVSPAGAQSLPTCSLNPANVTITSGGNGTSVITVQTTAASSTARLDPTRMKLFGVGTGTILAGLLLIGVPSGRRRWITVVVLWIVVAAGEIGCGGGGGNSSVGSGSSTPATTVGSYTFKVTGSDSTNSTIVIPTNVTVTVQ